MGQAIDIRNLKITDMRFADIDARRSAARS